MTCSWHVFTNSKSTYKSTIFLFTKMSWFLWKKTVLATFLISIFYLVLVEKKCGFVESEFMKTCHEHVICDQIDTEQILFTALPCHVWLLSIRTQTHCWIIAIRDLVGWAYALTRIIDIWNHTSRANTFFWIIGI